MTLPTGTTNELRQSIINNAAKLYPELMRAEADRTNKDLSEIDPEDVFEVVNTPIPTSNHAMHSIVALFHLATGEQYVSVATGKNFSTKQALRAVYFLSREMKQPDQKPAVGQSTSAPAPPTAPPALPTLPPSAPPKTKPLPLSKPLPAMPRQHENQATITEVAGTRFYQPGMYVPPSPPVVRSPVSSLHTAERNTSMPFSEVSSMYSSEDHITGTAAAITFSRPTTTIASPRTRRGSEATPRTAGAQGQQLPFSPSLPNAMHQRMLRGNFPYTTVDDTVSLFPEIDVASARRGDERARTASLRGGRDAPLSEEDIMNWSGSFPKR